MFVIGLMVGFVFLLKFNFILFFVGLLVPIYIYLLVKAYKGFCKIIVASACRSYFCCTALYYLCTYHQQYKRLCKSVFKI